MRVDDPQEQPNTDPNTTLSLTTETVNRYGLTHAEWSRLSSQERQRVRWRMKAQRRRREEPEKIRERDRRRYQRANKVKRAIARASYYRNHEKQLQRHRARHARNASVATARRSPTEIYNLISKHVPVALPRHDRDDLIGAMCLAVLEGALLIRNIRSEAKAYLTAHNREYDHHKTLSLDETLHGGKGAWIDNLTAEDLPW